MQAIVKQMTERRRGHHCKKMNSLGVDSVRKVDRYEYMGRHVETCCAVSANDPVFHHRNSDGRREVDIERKLDPTSFVAILEVEQTNR